MSQNRILANVPAHMHKALAAGLNEVALKQHDVLFERGGEIVLIYFPIGGLISMVVELTNGSTVEALTVGMDGFSDTAAFFGKDRATFKGIVQMSGAALTMPLAAFRSYLEVPAFRAVADMYVVQAVALMGQSAACLAFHPVEQRLARWLLEVQDRVETTELTLTHEFLAQMLGVQRPTATIAVNILVKADLITHRRGVLTIQDHQSLEEASCECYLAARTWQTWH